MSDEWQPIETAPYNREWTATLPFDLWEGPAIAYSDSDDEEGQEEPLFLVWYSQAGPCQAETTHWMPLPQPPEARSGPADYIPIGGAGNGA